MSKITGGCHCGAIRYQVEGELIVHALCHCADCRRHAGAPMVGWTMYAEDAVKVTKGQPKVYASSEHGRRQFCADCGTGLFYTNANILPGIIDIQSATYDDPDAVPAAVHIQVAERVRWMESAHELPTFDRYPPQAWRSRRDLRKNHSSTPRWRHLCAFVVVSPVTLSSHSRCRAWIARDLSNRGEAYRLSCCRSQIDEVPRFKGCSS